MHVGHTDVQGAAWDVVFATGSEARAMHLSIYPALQVRVLFTLSSAWLWIRC